MRDQTYLNKKIKLWIGTILPIRLAPVIKSLIEFYLFVIVAWLFSVNGLFDSFDIYKRMNTTVRDNSNSSIYFLHVILRLNIIFVTSGALFIIIIVTNLLW